jgi:hypothetical protein
MVSIDLASTQRNLDLTLTKGTGDESAYVKLGGDNVPRYTAPYYAVEVDRARAAGYRVGHYWVPNLLRDPNGAADYFVDSLHNWQSSDFVVLDNENLDGARAYGDAEIADWVNRVGNRLGIGGKQIKVYLPLGVARSNNWPLTLNAKQCDFIIAAYSYAPFTYDLLGKIAPSRNNGHQYGGAVYGGITVDIDAWKSGAFDYSSAAPTAAPTAPASSGTPYHPVVSGWAWNEPDAVTQQRIQQALRNRHRYGGPIDGVWGKLSIIGIQTTIKNVGYKGLIDGIPGPLTSFYVQIYAQKFGDYTGPTDKILGPFSWAGFALGLERP